MRRLALALFAAAGGAIVPSGHALAQLPARAAAAMAEVQPAAIAVPARRVTPYQHTRAINTGDCGGPQCVLDFPVVPEGKRLMLTSVSGQVTQSARTIVLEGGTATYFVANPESGRGYLNEEITFFYEAGAMPTARMFIQVDPGDVSLLVTLVGVLLPAQ